MVHEVGEGWGCDCDGVDGGDVKMRRGWGGAPPTSAVLVRCRGMERTGGGGRGGYHLAEVWHCPVL